MITFSVMVSSPNSWLNSGFFAINGVNLTWLTETVCLQIGQLSNKHWLYNTMLHMHIRLLLMRLWHIDMSKQHWRRYRSPKNQRNPNCLRCRQTKEGPCDREESHQCSTKIHQERKKSSNKRQVIENNELRNLLSGPHERKLHLETQIKNPSCLAVRWTWQEKGKIK